MSKPWEIIQGDVRTVLKTFESKSFDACFCDPPYGYQFMGRRWDYQLPSANVWLELLRVLKPGAFAMMFGGPRTFHRLACAVEDAGFEIRDLCMFLHGKGFPKNHDVSKGIDDALGKKRKQIRITNARNPKSIRSGEGVKGGDRPYLIKARVNGYHETAGLEPVSKQAKRWRGFGTALKPSHEPILVVRRMLDGTVANNVLKHGTGALNIDASRIGTEVRFNSPAAIGRWPANLLLDEEAAAMLDEQSGNRKGMSGGGKHRNGYRGGMFGGIDSEHTARNDDGGASRFFYTTKASSYEREAGLDDLEVSTVGSLAGGGEGANDPVSKRFTKEARNTHTTIKPIDLIRYFAKMLLPPPRDTPRRIIVPFSGVGSEIIGCLQAGWDEVIGIERETEYIAIAKERIAKGGVLSGLLDRKMRVERERESLGRRVYGKFARDKS